MALKKKNKYIKIPVAQFKKISLELRRCKHAYLLQKKINDTYNKNAKKHNASRDI